MIEHIFSPKNQDLLHIIVRASALARMTGDSINRADFVDASNFLQAAGIAAPTGSRFRAHRHLERSSSFDRLRAQEAWVVISGVVEVSLFDEDDTLLGHRTLEAGDMSLTLRGGHAYRVLQDAAVFEFKSGPYMGVEVDKTFLDEPSSEVPGEGVQDRP